MNQKNRDLDSLTRMYQALLWYSAMTLDKYGKEEATRESIELLRFFRFAYFLFALDMMPEGELDAAEKQKLLDSLGPIPTAEQLGWSSGTNVGSKN